MREFLSSFLSMLKHFTFSNSILMKCLIQCINSGGFGSATTEMAHAKLVSPETANPFTNSPSQIFSVIFHETNDTFEKN